MRHSLGAMATFKITWSKQGDHKDDEPRTVDAESYDIKDGVYTFIISSSMSQHPVFSVRQSDVSIVERLMS